MWFVFRPVLGFAFYYYLLKNFDRQKTDLWMAPDCFLLCAAVINPNHGALSGAGGPVIGGKRYGFQKLAYRVPDWLAGRDTVLRNKRVFFKCGTLSAIRYRDCS